MSTNIAAALVKAQKGFAPALKSSTNPHFRSKYADLSTCIEAVLDSLNENGIALMQVTHESQTGVIVETMFIHESGETLSAGKLHVPAAKNDPQGYGSALTYARRYSLMSACGIAPEDDDGNQASKSYREQKVDPELEAKRKFMQDVLKSVGMGTFGSPGPVVDSMLAKKGKKSLFDLTATELEKLGEWIKKEYSSDDNG